MCFFGDGTTNIGAFHEALNLAAVWKLPVVFVCENNMYMEYTAIDTVTAVKRPAADRAASYGLEPIIIDGNDADVCYLAAETAYERARRGDGPSLIEALTYRHGGHSRADPAKYRPDDEVACVAGTRSGARLPRAFARGRRRRSDARRRSKRRRWRRSTPRRKRRRTARRRAWTRSRPIPGPTGRRHGGTDVSRRGRGRDRARDGTRRDVVFLGEDIGGAGGVFKATVGLLERVRPDARARHADLRAGDPRRGDGRRDDRAAADRRDHVLGFPRRVLGHRRPTKSRRRAT